MEEVGIRRLTGFGVMPGSLLFTVNKAISAAVAACGGYAAMQCRRNNHKLPTCTNLIVSRLLGLAFYYFMGDLHH